LPQALLDEGFEDPIAAWQRFSRISRDKACHP